MRWLFRRDDDSAPQVLQLGDDAVAPAQPVQILESGEVSVSVRNAAEARDALLELQRRQRALVAGVATATGGGIAGLGSTVIDGVQRSGERVRRVTRRSTRAIRPSNASNVLPDSLDALVLSGQMVEGSVELVKLIGAAMHTIVENVPDVDLSDIDLDFLDLLDF